MSVDVAEGEVMVVVDKIMSDGEGRGVVLDSGTWVEFDSSHRPFLQWGDSRKSNRRKTLSTTTTGSRPKSHAPLRFTKLTFMQMADKAKSTLRDPDFFVPVEAKLAVGPTSLVRCKQQVAI